MTAAAAKSDFVEIQLSAAGVTFAGKGGQVLISTAHLSYKVAAGSTVRVLTSEWSKVLSKESWQGQPIFEVAPAATTAAPAAPAVQAPKLEPQTTQEGKK